MRKDKLADEQESMRRRMARLPEKRRNTYHKQRYRSLYVCDLPEACRIAALRTDDNAFMRRALEEAAKRLEHLRDDRTVIERSWDK